MKFPHHDRAIAEAIARYSISPDLMAIVLIGSLARGEERPDSDVDLYLIMRGQKPLTQHAFGETYEGTVFDVKVVTMEQLRAAPRSANDPMRASFNRSRVLWASSANVNQESTLSDCCSAVRLHWRISFRACIGF